MGDYRDRLSAFEVTKSRTLTEVTSISVLPSDFVLRVNFVLVTPPALSQIERQLGRRLRRFLLALPFGSRDRHPVHHDFHVEQPAVRRTDLAGEPIRRQPAIVRLQPLLQR